VAGRGTIFSTSRQASVIGSVTWNIRETSRLPFPGDALFLDFAGAMIQSPVLLFNGGSDGSCKVTNHKPVPFVTFETTAWTRHPSSRAEMRPETRHHGVQ
jgi:hypothetical protein